MRVCLIILVGVIKVTELFTVKDNNVTEYARHQKVSENSNFTLNDTHINKTEVVKIEKTATGELTNHTVEEEYSHTGNDSLRHAVTYEADKSGDQAHADLEQDSYNDTSEDFDRINCDCLKTIAGGGIG